MARKKKTAQVQIPSGMLSKYLTIAVASLFVVVARIVLYFTTLKDQNANANEPSSVIGTVVINKMYENDEGGVVASMKLSAVSNSGRVTGMKVWTGLTEPTELIAPEVMTTKDYIRYLEIFTIIDIQIF